MEDRSAYFTNGVPNPGSDEAEALGCLCPKSDNSYGLGFPYGEGHLHCFWMSADCPLHGQNIKEKTNDDDLSPV